MMASLLGWAILVAVLAVPAAVALEIVLLAIRFFRPGFKLQLLARATLVGFAVFGLWYAIPRVVYALIGPSAH
jgi:hypothetical protein